MIDNAKRMIAGLTSLGIALLGLGIIASLLSPTGRIPWLGDISGNIVGLINSLGSQGIVGLVALGVILYLFKE
jgi:hypothetical protein|tara:strand:+ start:244 stop:462 length:219 start_codon:yes stop_codon:yes gene_type:complete